MPGHVGQGLLGDPVEDDLLVLGEPLGQPGAEGAVDPRLLAHHLDVVTEGADQAPLLEHGRPQGGHDPPQRLHLVGKGRLGVGEQPQAVLDLPPAQPQPAPLEQDPQPGQGLDGAVVELGGHAAALALGHREDLVDQPAALLAGPGLGGPLAGPGPLHPPEAGSRTGPWPPRPRPAARRGPGAGRRRRRRRRRPRWCAAGRRAAGSWGRPGPGRPGWRPPGRRRPAGTTWCRGRPASRRRPPRWRRRRGRRGAARSARPGRRRSPGAGCPPAGARSRPGPRWPTSGTPAPPARTPGPRAGRRGSRPAPAGRCRRRPGWPRRRPGRPRPAGRRPAPRGTAPSGADPAVSSSPRRPRPLHRHPRPRLELGTRPGIPADPWFQADSPHNPRRVG